MTTDVIADIIIMTKKLKKNKQTNVIGKRYHYWRDHRHKYNDKESPKETLHKNVISTNVGRRFPNCT